MGCVEKFGNTIEGFISTQFNKLGRLVGTYPRRTIIAAFLVTVICGAGFTQWKTENRADKLWVPQNTIAETETELYESYFSSIARFNTIIIEAKEEGGNVLTKERLLDAIKMHSKIESVSAEVEEDEDSPYMLTDLCMQGRDTCVDPSLGGVCDCFVTGILKQWNYDVDTLTNDSDYMATLNSYGAGIDDLVSILGNPVVEDGKVVSADAFTISYFNIDRSEEAGSDEDGTEADPINEAWEEQAFLETVESVPDSYPSIAVNYFAGRSFSDEFGGAITGDLLLVQISYAVVFIFLGANLGKFIPGPESRWTMSLSALVLVGLSTGASFGLSAAFGLFFGPVHSLLPFILLGIGVDDAFVIVNAYNRERKVSRKSETNADLIIRSGKALARAGASITVTSLTDLVAFGISASSSLPALASFCAYAAVGIVFLWVFASTFFSATLVLDERRQRDNRRECLCCLTRGEPDEDGKEKEEESGFEEDFISTYFRNIHAPTILSNFGKAAVLLIFSGLLGFGIYGAINLSVEDTQRAFIPSDSYLTDYINAADEYFPDTGIDLYFVFEGGSDIYSKRENLANLKDRLTGLSGKAPYIAEPTSENTYQNVMTGLSSFLTTSGSAAIGGATLGADGWPTSEEDFFTTLSNYVTGPGAKYITDLSYSDDNKLEALRVKSRYVALTKPKGSDIIDDADRQIDAMDATRDMVDAWGDDLPSVTTFSEKFLAIEGFKIIRKELFLNVGLALAAVTIIVFFTVASPLTSIIISLNVAFCIVEILGFMYALGIAIDSVSVINIVLAVGLSIDYSAHVGHCFMLKGGENKDRRVLEALADIGAAVFSGALSTFLAVVVLLFSSSYVFVTLSKQFALTVGLGVIHGLVLLPVLLSLLGPKPFEAAEMPTGPSKVDKPSDNVSDDLVLEKESA